MEKRFKDLTESEKQILAIYLLRDSKTQGFDAANGVIGALEKQDILVRVTNFGYHSSFQYGIQPWAWQYLKKHPEKVGLSKESIAEHQKAGRRRS